MPLYLPDLLNVSPAVLYQKRKNTAPCGIALRLQCICESNYKHQITNILTTGCVKSRISS